MYHVLLKSCVKISYVIRINIDPFVWMASYHVRYVKELSSHTRTYTQRKILYTKLYDIPEILLVVLKFRQKDQHCSFPVKDVKILCVFGVWRRILSCARSTQCCTMFRRGGVLKFGWKFQEDNLIGIDPFVCEEGAKLIVFYEIFWAAHALLRYYVWDSDRSQSSSAAIVKECVRVCCCDKLQLRIHSLRVYIFEMNSDESSVLFDFAEKYTESEHTE